MKRWLREPLVHFLLLGAALFAVHAVLSRSAGPEDDEIVVTAAQVQVLTDAFAGTWQRPPTPEELDGLIQEYVREEAACREALALGLDRDDTVIRHRLRQKLEFISEDTTSEAEPTPQEPTDDELRAFLAQHAADYRIDPRYTFSQEPQDGGSDGPALPSRYSDAGEADIARSFGEEFARQLARAPLGQWTGPVTSRFGQHRVRVESRTGSRAPDLEEVRGAVRRDFETARRAQATDRLYENLLRRYKVTIERGPAP